jgi:class 3 adenylate cyclase/YHS domain-containing protein
MEQDIAILMADLSGYTALTETHGSFSAADVIDKYTAIVETCLVGQSHLHQRTGDEVMIVSTSPGDLISTAMMIIQNTSKEDNFLQVHGGLHYGKILKRNNHYFGNTINITSRIVSKATPGTFWCSEAYINALADRTSFTFLPKGKHRFKNISEETEMYELFITGLESFSIDPVCRMLLNKKDNLIPHPAEENIFFCSQNCLNIYINNNIYS